MAELRDAELFGTSAPTAAVVTGVVLVEEPSVMSVQLPVGSVVLLALGQSSESVRGHLIDVMLRRAHDAQVSLVLVVGRSELGVEVPEATVSLAAWFGMPLLLARPGTSALEVAVAVRRLVSDPDLLRLEAVQATLRRLPRGPRSPQEIRALIESLLPEANVALLADRGLVVEGELRYIDSQAVLSCTDEKFMQHDDVFAVVSPIMGLDGTASWWLVVERDRAGRLWLESASAVLAMVSASLLTWLVREQAELERDARMRASLLSEIIEHGDHPPPEVQELLARGGWHLGGWHTGLHLRFHPKAPSALGMEALAGELSALGLQGGSFVERADGWAAWVTSPDEPTPADVRGQARIIERSLSVAPGTRVVVGVGSPHRDAAGLGRTLAEARHACTIAAGGTRPVTLRVMQELGPSRLLLGWHASEALGDYSREILGGLLDESEAEVLVTLQAYLERACSTAQTARALGLHRNTVSKRIARAESILGTTTAAADTRLALQLAIRVLHSS